MVLTAPVVCAMLLALIAIGVAARYTAKLVCFLLGAPIERARRIDWLFCVPYGLLAAVILIQLNLYWVPIDVQATPK